MRLGNTKIRVRFGFFCVLGLFAYLAPTRAAELMLLAVLIHEIGHLCAMSLCGVRLVAIEIGPFGARMTTDSMRLLTYPCELLIYLAGPLVGLASAGIALLIWGGATADFVMASLGLSAFNLLPVETLDGGSIVYAALSSRWGPMLAARWLRILTWAILPPLFGIAFILLLQEERNISLLITCTYLALIALLL